MPINSGTFTSRRHFLLRHFLLLCLAAATVIPSYAATPDVAGKWRLNKAKSEIGGQVNVEKLIWTIEQNEPKIIVRIQQDENFFDITYFTDGREGRGSGYPGTNPEPTSRAEWKDGALYTKVNHGGDNVVASVWKLSADGKTITIDRTRQGGMSGPVTQKLVFEKQ